MMKVKFNSVSGLLLYRPKFILNHLTKTRRFLSFERGLEKSLRTTISEWNPLCIFHYRALNKYIVLRNRRRAWTDRFTLGSEGGTGNEVNAIFDQIKQSINPRMVEENQAVFLFEIKGHGSFFIDLKNGNGNAGRGKPLTEPDAILTIDANHFKEIFAGKLKPNVAILLGKLRVGGSTSHALKLEKLLPKFRGESG